MTKTAAMAAVLAALGYSVVAQTINPPATTNPPVVTSPLTVSTEPPKVVMPPAPSPLTNSLNALKPRVKIVAPKITPAAAKPERPGSPADVAAPTDVKNLVEQFQRAREDFIARQRAMTALPRNQLTEQQRQNWEEERKRLRQEIRDRLIQIKNEFRSRELLEVLDAAKEAAKPRRIGEDN
jgi:hypothetical protein